MSMKKVISKTRTKRASQRDKTSRQGLRPKIQLPLMSVLAFVTLWTALIILLVAGRGLQYSALAEGQRSPATMIASVDFTSEDVPKTKLLKQRSAERIPPVFIIQQTELTRSLRMIQSAVDLIQQTAVDDPEIQTQIDDRTELLEWLSPLNALTPNKKIALLQSLSESLTQVWNRGILSEEQLYETSASVGGLGMIQIAASETAPSRKFSTDNVLTKEAAVIAVLNDVKRAEFFPGGLEDLQGMTFELVQPNLVYDDTRTSQLQEDAIRKIEAIIFQVHAGTTLVEKGERLTPHILELLRTHELKQESLVSATDRLKLQIGAAGIIFLLTLMSASLLYIYKPDHFKSPSICWLLVAATLVSLVPLKGLLIFSASTRIIEPALIAFIVPLALTPMLVTILCGSITGFIAGLLSSLTAFSISNFSLPVLLIGLLSTTVALITLRLVRRRTDVFKAGGYCGLACSALAVFLTLLEQYELSFSLPLSLAALVGGSLSAVLVILLLPLFEIMFHRTTDIRLLELSDMGHPLLQRLALEAPGTYHHSLMVASLAQAAAQEIGCNALLARVCAYFHDIGKLTKPECFIENAQLHANPHDHFSPHMSSLIIIAHVKEGISLAIRHKLPSLILDAIQQHHGTSKISYFYHRAKKTSEQLGPVKTPKDKPDEQSFRYPGPKPQRPEMGILIIADSVEAASRSMDKITPSRVEALVSDIMQEKIQDGQLDECHLTLSQLSVIKKSLIFNLTNMVHSRTKYPEDEDKHSDDTAAGKTGSTNDSETNSMDDGKNPDS